jgi:hypothetical protein
MPTANTRQLAPPTGFGIALDRPQTSPTVTLPMPAFADVSRTLPSATNALRTA